MTFASASAAWLKRCIARLWTGEGAWLVALLALTALVRLPLMPFQGYFHDLASYSSWGTTLVNHGFSGLYTVQYRSSVAPGDEIDSAINYPPGTPYLFGALVWLYSLTVAHATHTSLLMLLTRNGWGPFIAKLPMLLADLATTALLYWQARKRHTQRFALLAAGSYALAPALLYDGAIWGQTDGLVALPILFALFAILDRRYALAGACLALTALIKPQPAIFIPLALLYIWRWSGKRAAARFAVAGLGVGLILLLPVMLPRFQLPIMLGNMQAMSYNDQFPITGDAFNLWWLAGSRRMGTPLLGVTSAQVGDILFLLVLIACGVRLWRRREPEYLFFGAALEVVGFFVFTGGQHERYLFLFIPLTLASIVVTQRKRIDRLVVLYLVGGTLSFLNMMVAVGVILYGRSPMLPYGVFPSLTTWVITHYAILSFAIAIYNLILFACALWLYLSGGFAPERPERPARPDTWLKAQSAETVSLAMEP
jgi:hypothetical protein